jgi:hypothetical protein
MAVPLATAVVHIPLVADGIQDGIPDQTGKATEARVARRTRMDL